MTSAKSASTAPIRTVVTGATGRMGATLVRLLRDDPAFAFAGGTERRGHGSVGQDLGVCAGGAPLGLPVVDDLAKLVEGSRAQVVIDFTGPEASVEHARVCAAAKVALVVGSTGLSAEQRGELEKAAAAIPLVVAPNMSVGVNLVIEAARSLAQRLGEGFDIEIVEAHHRHKKDAPSGTALWIASEIARAVGRSESDLRLERSGQIGARPAREIGVQTVRGGDVVGDHTVLFLGEGERVELTHRATSRDQFGRGALRAAQWIVGRPPGLYSMRHVLGLEGA